MAAAAVAAGHARGRLGYGLAGGRLVRLGIFGRRVRFCSLWGRFAFAIVAFGLSHVAAGMAVSSTDVAFDGFGAKRFSPARAVSSAMGGDRLDTRVVSAAMLGESAASGAMRDGLDFPALSASVGGSASSLPSCVLVEGVAEAVESDAMLVAPAPSGLGRVPAAIAPPTARPSADAVGVIAASTLLLGPTSSVSATTGAAAGMGRDREATFEVWSVSSERLCDADFITPAAALTRAFVLGEPTARDVSLTPCEPAKTQICLFSEPLVSVGSTGSALRGGTPADVFAIRKVETSQKPPVMSKTLAKIAATMSPMLGNMMFDPRRLIHSIDYPAWLSPSGAQCRLSRLTKLRQSRPAPDVLRKLDHLARQLHVRQVVP